MANFIPPENFAHLGYYLREHIMVPLDRPAKIYLVRPLPAAVLRLHRPLLHRKGVDEVGQPV